MISKNSRRVYISLCVVIIIIGLSVFSACEQQTPNATGTPTITPSPAATGPKTGGTMHLSISADANRIGFPPTILTFQDVVTSKTSVEMLMRVDAEGNTVPWLAEDWTIDTEAKTITFKLKKGVKFSDGTDFNAEAVKWNLEKYTASGRTEIQKISSYDIIDDYTLRCNLSEWDATTFMALAWQAGYMISPTAWQNAPDTASDKDRDGWAENNPVGTGPFVLESWSKGTKQVYKKNPNYWGKNMPYLDGLVWDIIADPMTANAAFQAKEVDIIFGISPSTAKNLQSAGVDITELKSGLGVQFKGLMANSAKEGSPFKNVDMRKVLGYAIDSQALINGVYLGFASPIVQYMPQSNQWANPDVKGYAYNLEKAREIMTAAGYSESKPLNVSIMTESTPDDVQTCEALQAMLADAYMDVKIEKVERGLMMQHQRAGTWDSLLYGTFRLDPEPSLQFVRIISNKTVIYGPGLLHFDDIESNIVKMTSAPTTEARKQIVHQLQQLVFEKYCLFSPYFMINGLAAKQPFVNDDNFMTVKMDQWTPESAWLDK